MKIVSAYQIRFPHNLEKMVKRILRSVPQQYTTGLHSVILVDRITRKKVKDALGIYVPKSDSEMPHIEIAVETTFGNIPRFVFFLPFVTKVLLAGVLFHEIGHHYQTLSRTPKRGEVEMRADEFKKMMLRKAFPGWRFILRPFSPLLRPLRRRVGKDKNSYSHQ